MLTKEQLDTFNKLLQPLTSQQKLWLSGYIAGLGSDGNTPANAGSITSSAMVSTNGTPFTILYGSRSGNSEIVAKKLADRFLEGGIMASCHDLNDYQIKELKKVKNFALVVSTHGEGVPPVSAEEFYESIHSKRAPKLEGVNYSVCALGDSSYEFYCKTGIDFDKRFRELGAKPLAERADCDVDFEDKADAWIEDTINSYKKIAGDNVNIHQATEEKATTGVSKNNYSKKNPFNAGILEKILLSGRGSAKEVYHLELSLEGSGITFHPGDALGIVPTNSDMLVDELINFKKYNSETIIQNGVGSKPLIELLKHHYELTILTKDVVSQYANLSGNNDLDKILSDADLLRKYLYGRDVLDLVTDFPAELAPEEFVGILRKLQPRLYSIASSLNAYSDEVHITVGAVRYEKKGRRKNGVCSSLMADRVETDDTLPVYIDNNPMFKLPDNPDTPIIMVGPGTGIAPFRSFIQEREVVGANGKNWLFFGDQHFTTDFLYQLEWQKYLKKGILNRLDIAFSRDTSEKIYVQHRMKENARDLYSWLQEGAYLYVCGDMKNMAMDVHKSLVEIVELEGGKSNEDALQYVRNLQKSKRYQEDVY